MDWLEIKVETTTLGTELLGGVFSALGIDTLDINCGEEYAQEYLADTAMNWDFADMDEIAPEKTPSISAYIAELPENALIVDKLREGLSKFAVDNPDLDLGTLNIETRIVKDEDWANNWKKYYKPMNIGERLLVCPTWEPVPDGNTRRVLSLDPGMAFGSGTHETTRMCLEQLEKLTREGASVIDLGCGSGILSIAAQLLGAGKLVAVDIDPVCTEVAKENAELNHVTLDTVVGNVINDDMFFASLKARADGGKYDIVVANIVAGVLIALSPRIPELLKTDGVFISSGIIHERLDEVCESYRAVGLEILDITRMGEWAAVTARLIK